MNAVVEREIAAEVDKIMLPGVHDGVSSEDYHSFDALGSSMLKQMARSPLHCFGRCLDPHRPASEPSDAMAAGTLAHCALLEPEALDSRYVIVPAGAPRKPSSVQRNAKKPSDETVAAIRWWDKFQSEHGTKEVIEVEQLQTAMRQAESIRELPEICALLAKPGGRSEVSAFWVDEATGLVCKCRPDRVCPGGEKSVVLLDLKTAKDASPEGFARAIWNFRYDLQAVHYSEGFEKASGLMVLGFCFVVVESEYPHAAAAYLLDDESMLKARGDHRVLLERYAKCRRDNFWPGYAQQVVPISLPRWALAA